MHVGHYIDSLELSRGGPQRAVLDTLRILAEAGHKASVFSFDTDVVPAGWNGSAGLPNVVAIQSLDQVPLETLDVLHLHGIWDINNHRLARRASRAGLPYVVTLHGQLDDWPMGQKSLKKSLFMRALGRRHLERAAAVHCTAESERKAALRRAPGAKAALVPYLIDLSFAHPLPSASLAGERLAGVPPGFRVLFLGRVHYKKGPDVLIDAVHLARLRGVEVQLLMVGPVDDEYQRELQAQVDRLGMRSSTHWLGMVSGPLKYAIYAAADVFALPTNQENFGIVLIESLACGTPVITTTGCAIADELQSAGGIIADRTPEAFAQAILRLAAEDPKTRRDRGMAGRDWVLTTLAPSTLLRQYEAFYQAAIGSSRRP